MGTPRSRLASEGRRHPSSGMDYFVFPRGMLKNMPDFAVGRPGWDNWMIFNARVLRIPVIDATGAVTAIHQNHDYAHHPGLKEGVVAGPEAQRNIALLGGSRHSLNIRHADFILTAQGPRRPHSISHLLYELEALPAKAGVRFSEMA